MTWLLRQIWLWMVLAFLLGAMVTWVVLVRRLPADEAELDTDATPPVDLEATPVQPAPTVQPSSALSASPNEATDEAASEIPATSGKTGGELDEDTAAEDDSAESSPTAETSGDQPPSDDQPAADDQQRPDDQSAADKPSGERSPAAKSPPA